MQLRPRDGTGKVATTNDGKLRSFTKIMDQDESDDLTYEGVRGGKIYKMLKDTTNANYVKFAEYKQDNDVNKKVPKINNMYKVVKDLISGCMREGSVAAGNAKWDYKTITDIRKYYVGNDLIKERDFNKILKEQNLLVKEKPDENVTDHNDIKGFVDDAIATYRKMHPNRPISLSAPKYIAYVNKVLKRVRANYLKSTSGTFTPLTFKDNKSVENSVYKGYPAGTTEINRDKVKDTAVKLIDQTLDAPIVINININKKMAESDVDDIGETFKALDPLFADTDDAKNLKELIEEMYKQFVRRTEKLIQKDKTIAMTFQDGGRKHRSGGTRKPAHKSAHKSAQKRCAGRSRR